MRNSVPHSLLLVTTVRASDDAVVVRGPFVSVEMMRLELTGCPYPVPEPLDECHQLLLRYDTSRNCWVDPSGHELLVWSAASVDEINQLHTEEQRRKAQWVESEFPAEQYAGT